MSSTSVLVFGSQKTTKYTIYVLPNEFFMKGTFLSMPYPPSSCLQNFTLKIKTNGWSGFGF